ncbi:hypothetical protein GQ457_05G005770 [Hibiscus cannabinus]
MLSMDMGHPEEEDVATAGAGRRLSKKLLKLSSSFVQSFSVLLIRTLPVFLWVLVLLLINKEELFSHLGAWSHQVDFLMNIILGPVVAEVIFANKEETMVQPLYGDPVHDFGFFRYTPESINFLEYEEIPLVPEAACVGLDIKVIGNDSGEKVSILSGTLACLNRDAPNYKNDGYNDFNTFYMQAATGTNYGSIGSPVIDWHGRAVAMHVVRALEFLRYRDYYIDKWEAVPIPRGTLQVTFVHKGFDEIRWLGLSSEAEQFVRASAPAATGMLVVDSVVPGSPAQNLLKAGDMLVRGNGQGTHIFIVDSKLPRVAQVPLVYTIYTGRHMKQSVLVTVDCHECIRISSVHALGNLHSQDGKGIGSKQRQIEDDMSSDGVVTNGSLNETGEAEVENKIDTENAAYASNAERVIDPSLVMLESICHDVHSRRGDSVYIVGLNESLQVTSKKSVVTNTSKTDLEIIELDTDFGRRFSGVLTDEHGRVQALWGRFSSTLRCTNTSKDPHFVGGIPVYAISQVLDKIKSGASGPSRLINGSRLKRFLHFVYVNLIALCSLGYHPSGGVYVTRCCPGSPADRYELFPLQWIVKVGGRRTSSLDGFVNATERLEHEEFVLVKTVDLDGNSQYITLKQDLRYWPTWEVRFDPETAIWRRTVIKAVDDSDNP